MEPKKPEIEIKETPTGNLSTSPTKETPTGSLSILDSVTKPITEKLDQVDRTYNPFRKVTDQLKSGGK